MCIKASPFRDEDGEVLKWYGTITDIHDLVMARIKARRKQQQVMTVLAHAEVNLFSIDTDRKITLAEGGMFWDSDVDVSVKTTMVGYVFTLSIYISEQTHSILIIFLIEFCPEVRLNKG